MHNSDLVPKEILDKIGFHAWERLSWALHKGWVQDYKYFMSRDSGYDIGTPKTVEKMCCETMAFGFYPLNIDFIFNHQVKTPSIREFEKLMIEGYLLGTDFVSPIKVRINGKTQYGIVPDNHGKNQLEGELRRYWAMKNNTLHHIDRITLTREVIDDYCSNYVLDELAQKFAERLEIQ